MLDEFQCAACGRTLADGETVYSNGLDLYCRSCRYIFLEKNKEGLALVYRAPAFEPCTCAGCGSEIPEGQMLYLFDADSPVYCSADEFLQAEKDRVADEYREIIRKDKGGLVPFLTPGRVQLYKESRRRRVWKL